MPRQPLRSIDRNAGFALGPGFLEQRPKAMALVGECIALWTEVELQAAVLLGVMLKAGSPPAAALYFTLANERAKRDAMTAIAENVLPEQERAVVAAWLLLKRSIEKDRVDLAHGLFGVSEVDNEGIIWVNTNDRIKNIIEMMQSANDMKKMDLLSRDLSKDIYLYRIKDLEKIKYNIMHLHEVSHKLVTYIAISDVKSKSSVYHWLSQSPLLSKFLSQTSSSPKSDL